MAIKSIYDYSSEAIVNYFKGKPKIPGIIDADELIGECDMNFDHELIAWQCENSGKLGRENSGASYNLRAGESSPVELERQVKNSLKKKLDDVR